MYLPGTKRMICDTETCDSQIKLPEEIWVEDPKLCEIRAERFAGSVYFWDTINGKHRCIWCT
jgi:hypothetical protein